MQTSGDTVSRGHLTRLPRANAIQAHVSLNDPALSEVIGGSIAVEQHGDAMTFLIAGAHGSEILHITPSESFVHASTRIHAALVAVSMAQASYPVSAPSDSEVSTRQNRNYGS